MPFALVVSAILLKALSGSMNLQFIFPDNVVSAILLKALSGLILVGFIILSVVSAILLKALSGPFVPEEPAQRRVVSAILLKALSGFQCRHIFADLSRFSDIAEGPFGHLENVMFFRTLMSFQRYC